MLSFGATFKVDPLFLFNGILQAILVSFSIKTSRACTDMLSYENDAFKFSKNAKNTNSTCTIVPWLVELETFSKPVCR